MISRALANLPGNACELRTRNLCHVNNISNSITLHSTNRRVCSIGFFTGASDIVIVDIVSRTNGLTNMNSTCNACNTTPGGEGRTSGFFGTKCCRRSLCFAIASNATIVNITGGANTKTS